MQSNGLPQDGRRSGGDSEPRPAGLDRATELELINTALLGDAQAFSELFEHYRPALYGLCCRRLNDPSLAEDVVQEAFLKAFKNLSSYDRGKPVWPWLSTIAHRMCVDLQRHRSLTQYFADLGLAVDEEAEVHGHARSALDEVMASEERAELWNSLDVLPERQRRALLSYALDDMSYADIAAAEGISIGAVKLLIVRARRKIRSVRQGGPLPAIVFPFTWLRWKLQRIEERVRPLLGIYSEGFSTACAQVVCLGALTTMVVAASYPTEPLDVMIKYKANKAILSMQSQSPLTASLQTALPNVGAPTKAPVEPQQSASDPASSSVNDAIDVIDLNQDATPENSSLYSIAASPNYENDHTVLAAGNGYYAGHVLFVSRDGGASWKPQGSRLPLRGQYKLVLSPGYPQDRRMFVLGDFGLMQSDDGGEIFRPTSSLWVTSLAISPDFGRGDPRILIGAKNLFEYNANTGVTQPSSLPVPPTWGGSSFSSINFSPTFMSDSTVFVSERYGKGDLISSRFDRSTLYRCKESICDETEFPFSGPLTFRLSPRFDQDGLAYLFTRNYRDDRLLISNDGGRTFRDLQLPDPGAIVDMDILWGESSTPGIFTYVVNNDTGGVYRSLDGGLSWSNGPRIDLPSFVYGVKNMIVTPTGRLLATGMYGGIACSEDKGQTWAPRCTPEQ